MFRREEWWPCPEISTPRPRTVIVQEGGVVAPPGDIYAEAKNWAGELISGQTRAGKILVSIPFRSTKLCNYSSRFMLIFDIKMCIKCV